MASENPPWLVRIPLAWQGSRVNSGEFCWLCLSPRTCLSLRRSDLGLGYGLAPSGYCPEAPLPESMA